MVLAAIFALLCVASIQIGWLTVSAFRMNLVLGYNRSISVPVTDIASRCFVLALCMVYGQFQQTRRGLQPLSWPAAALLTLLPLAGLGCICAIVWPEVRGRSGPDADIGRVPWVLCMLLVALELVLVLGVVWTLRALKLQRQCQQQLRQQEKEHGQMEELRQMFCSQRIQTHEYRNRLTVLSMLLAQQQYGEANTYLQQLTQYTYQDSPTVQTNHPIADAVPEPEIQPGTGAADRRAFYGGRSVQPAFYGRRSGQAARQSAGQCPRRLPQAGQAPGDQRQAAVPGRRAGAFCPKSAAAGGCWSSAGPNATWLWLADGGPGAAKPSGLLRHQPGGRLVSVHRYELAGRAGGLTHTVKCSEEIGAYQADS